MVGCWRIDVDLDVHIHMCGIIKLDVVHGMVYNVMEMFLNI